MFSSLLFPGLGRLAATSQVDNTSAAGATSLMALHEAEVVNRSPVLRPTTAAENKSSLAASESVGSNVDSKYAKSPLAHSTPRMDENVAPAAVEAGNNSTDDVFHTPLITAGSDTSLKLKEAKVAASASMHSIAEDTQPPSATQEGECKPATSLQIRRGKIEPLDIPVPTTYAEATNLASIHPDAAEFILAIPISPDKPSRRSAAKAKCEKGNSVAKIQAQDIQARRGRPSDVPPADKVTNDVDPTHSPSRPNWAKAPTPSPDNQPKNNGRRRRGPKGREVSSTVRPGSYRRQSGGPQRHQHRSHVKPADQEVDDKDDQQRSTPMRTPRSLRTRGSPYSGVTKERTRITPKKLKTPDPEGDSPGPSSDTRSALHLAQVDALIKELQKTRGLLETPPISAAKKTEEKKDHTKASASGPRASSLPPEGSSSPAQAKMPWVWVAGHDGVLRPDMRMERPMSAPRPARPDPSAAFLPAGMQDLSTMSPGFVPIPVQVPIAPVALPMKRVYTPIPPWALFPTGVDPVEQYLEKYGMPPPPSSAFDNPARQILPQVPAGRASGRPRSRNPSGQTPIRAAEEPASWRMSKLPKDTAGGSKPVGPNPPSTAGPPISPVQPANWPTLDEICAKKILPSA